MTPAVSVVIPTHDRLDLLPWTLGSVLAQRDSDFEVVVVDDASSDGTAEWLAELDDRRIRIVRRREAGGAAAARNTGLAAATAPWVAFCDDDDLWAPAKLAHQLRALEAEPRAGWCGAGAVSVDAQGRIVEVHRMPGGGDVLDRLLVANLIPGGGSGVVARTELAREVGGFDESQLSSEDWDLWIRLAEAAPLAVVDRPLVAYRIWDGGKSRKVVRMAAAYETVQARYRHLADRRGVRPDPVRHRRYLARQQLRSGDRFGAAKSFVGLAKTGHPAHLCRAAAALLVPNRYERFATARTLRAAPDGWIDDAAAWIREIQPARGGVGQPR
jgi:glycosyltransferase involved in cell wall biosynthesis